MFFLFHYLLQYRPKFTNCCTKIKLICWKLNCSHDIQFSFLIWFDLFEKKYINHIFSMVHFLHLGYNQPVAQVEFTESKETADDRANIGGTIIGVPIVGQQLA